ncbi:MAG: YebC/PmpR family DNA-binding transcriptional regulator [Parcubacteria group bacterium]
MSGHSKWSTIKRKKGVNDAKRGQIFTKMANLITVAARSGGGDPEMNFKLRLAIDRAREENMPADNIQRAITKGAGELGEGVQLEELKYEAYGPGGVALIIEAITDNKNRTLAEVKTALKDNDGRMGEMGSVAWMFKSCGVVRILGAGSDEIEMAAIEAGADDIEQPACNALPGRHRLCRRHAGGRSNAGRQDEGLVITTAANKLSAVKESLAAAGAKVESAGMELIPKDPLKIEDEDILGKIAKLIEALDDLDDVSEVYSNLDSRY